MSRRSLIRGLLVWLILSGVGGVIVALPDDGGRLFSLSETHGPSAPDAAGAIVLIMGWLVFAVALWRARARIRHRTALGILAVVGAACLVWTITHDAGAWYVLGVVLLAGAQILAAVSAIRSPD